MAEAQSRFDRAREFRSPATIRDHVLIRICKHIRNAYNYAPADAVQQDIDEAELDEDLDLSVHTLKELDLAKDDAAPSTALPYRTISLSELVSMSVMRLRYKR